MGKSLFRQVQNALQRRVGEVANEEESEPARKSQTWVYKGTVGGKERTAVIGGTSNRYNKKTS